MSTKAMNIIGNVLYAIGALTLILFGAASLVSAGMIILAGPIIILFPILGAALFAVGKKMINQAKNSSINT